LLPVGKIAAWPPHLPREIRNTHPELRAGEDAYRFLLEVTTGLRSAIPGETNVFGQFKKAWLSFRCTGQAAHVARLAPMIYRLINDTKAIRQEHLEGLGGSSYGSLVRKLIAPKQDERILFVGAGSLTQSILPLFRAHSLGIWNHRPIETPCPRVARVFLPDQGEQAANWADHVIVTTPPDGPNDANWEVWLATSQLRSVVHLGHRDSNGHTQQRAWGHTPARYGLNDVFALHREQNDLRSAQLMLARAACRAHAKACVAADRLAAQDKAAAEGRADLCGAHHANLALA
jgi:hypothetical protein